MKVTISVTREEHGDLEQRAGKESIPNYIRAALGLRPVKIGRPPKKTETETAETETAG